MIAVAAMRYTLKETGGTLRISKDAERHQWKLEYLFGADPDLDAVEYVDSVPEWMAFVRESCVDGSAAAEDY